MGSTLLPGRGPCGGFHWIHPDRFPSAVHRGTPTCDFSWIAERMGRVARPVCRFFIFFPKHQRNNAHKRYFFFWVAIRNIWMLLMFFLFWWWRFNGEVDWERVFFGLQKQVANGWRTEVSLDSKSPETQASRKEGSWYIWISTYMYHKN